MSETQQAPAEEGSGNLVAIERYRAAAGIPANDPKWTLERIRGISLYSTPAGAKFKDIVAFLAVAYQYQLNPVLGEIWLADLNAGQGAPQLKVVVGRDAYVKVAQSIPTYEGHESGVIYAKDVFKLTRANGKIEIQHVVTDFMNRGEIVGAYAVIRDKLKLPVLILRRAKDYEHLFRKVNWTRYKEDMMETRVLTAGFRRMYNLAGIYVESELGDPGAAEEQVSGEIRQATQQNTQGIREQMDALRARRAAAAPKDAEVIVTAAVEPGESGDDKPDFETVVTSEGAQNPETITELPGDTNAGDVMTDQEILELDLKREAELKAAKSKK